VTVESRVSPEAKQFLQGSIKSVWSLELLLLMRRDGRGWTIEDLVRETRSSALIVQEALGAFVQSGLAVEGPQGTFTYRPAVQILDEWVGQIEAAYASKPSAVIRAIFASPESKVQIFADAFKLRGNE
jgi:hypothetical protein